MTAPKVAIIAGRGLLPTLIARSLEAQGTPFVLAQMQGFVADNPGGWPVETFRIEQLAPLFDRLAALDVAQVIFAGAVQRPQVDPQTIDPKTAALLPRLLPAFQTGDDSLLRAVIGLFEEAGFAVVGTADIAPDLLAGEGVLTKAQPSEAERADADRAAKIVGVLGREDIGQGAVVAGGLCVAVETLPGTDAMLGFVAGLDYQRAANGARGVFFKAPKPGQDRRIDLPTIGPDTIEACAKAGIAGLAIEAGGVLMLDRDALLARADALGLFIWGRPA